MAYAFFPKRLSNDCQDLCSTSEICTKFDAFLLSDPSQNYVRRGMRLQIKGRKNQPSTQLREILYTGSQDMLVLPSTKHHGTTTAIWMAAPEPEIMDTHSDMPYK
jgi:hypothetical protein